MDIMKFLVLYILVLFAFGCGLNQLLWYYADLEWHKCYDQGKGGIPSNLKGELLSHQASKVLLFFLKAYTVN